MKRGMTWTPDEGTELDRLREINAELLRALREVHLPDVHSIARDKIRAAIAKAERNQ